MTTTRRIDRERAGSSVPYAGAEEDFDAQFLAAAWAADAELCALINQTNKSKALQSGVLERISLARYYAALGFSSVQAYAAHRGVEPSERKAKELCALEARLERFPDIRAAYIAGEFEWTKVRDAAPAITPETEHVWLERLRGGWTNRQLEDQARVDRGLPAIRRLTLTVTAETGALYDQLVADVVRTAGWMDGMAGARGAPPVLRRDPFMPSRSRARLGRISRIDDHSPGEGRHRSAPPIGLADRSPSMRFPSQADRTTSHRCRPQSDPQLLPSEGRPRSAPPISLVDRHPSMLFPS